MNSISESILQLKEEFVKNYTGKSHTYEIVPNNKTDFLPINDKHLSLLHRFLEKNPIYTNSFEGKFCGISCRVFEGDLSQFWINSIKHDTSYAPFYPTWMLSAYSLALESKKFGFSELVDIGSGDGRIAFCGAIVNMKSYSIEIDEQLSILQNNIKANTSVIFDIINKDATKIDFGAISLNSPVFFIGGLPENGEMLAEFIIKNTLELSNLVRTSCFVLTGTLEERKFSIKRTNYGWGSIIEKFKLKITRIETLPTYWTMSQKLDTPYLFTKPI